MSHKIKIDKIPTVPTEKISENEAEKESLYLIEKLIKIQNKLYAQKKYAILIVLQGMDASGKDSAVKKVFSGVNPGGCNAKAFKKPTEEEAAHHFLWRVSKECPEKGYIQIFNRSHYEDILVPAVNKTISDKMIKERCNEINAFERGLVMDNTIVMKFYLHVSHKEQVERLKERKTDPQKQWKYQADDVLAIGWHDKFKKVYKTIFKNCSEEVEWHIIPADKKWYKNYTILKQIVETLEKYEIEYPKLK
jgi:PPK2 family polyphosphate:nucleotide phosphotransferase